MVVGCCPFQFLRAQRGIVRYLLLPETAAKLPREGAIPTSNTPEQLHERIKSEIPRWAKVLKAAGL